MLRNLTVTTLLVGCACLATTIQAAKAKAGKDSSAELHDLAVLMHNRIVGVPAQGETLKKMIDLLAEGKAQEAALLATEHPFFYDFKLQVLFSPWSNREGSIHHVPNDMITTMIGMVRDDIPFNKVLSDDIYFSIGESSQSNTPNTPIENATDPQEKMDKATYVPQSSLSLKNQLQQHKQSEKPHTDKNLHGGISGVLSTYAFGAAFYEAGTNRRATAFVLKNFLCHEIEELHDNNTPSHWVRQDVNRHPSGSNTIFTDRCVGCHAGMDALSGWSVFYDYNNNQFFWTNGSVQAKIFKNNLLRDGKLTLAPNKDEGRNYGLSKNKNDQFTNLWTEGKNKSLGWRGKTSGKGAKEFGTMITGSKAFSSCMASHVYKAVCYLDPDQGKAKTIREQLAEQFEKDKYNMRKLFATTAVACLTKKKENNAGSGGQE